MSTPNARTRLPRELHPVAWWVWALGVAAAASSTTNPLILAELAAVTCVVVFSCRGDGTWARSFKLYLWLAGITVAIRVIFRVVLGTGAQGNVLFTLPEIPLPEAAAGIRLLGPVTSEQLLSGLYDGMQLALIMLAFGAANSLANPKRLLKNLPPALYEIGSALVVAVSVLPQLVDSARRVKYAQELRGGADGRIAGLRRLLVPVLEDAFDRSLALAAGMDARGYGRSGTATRAERRRTSALMLGALLATVAGVYGYLNEPLRARLGWPMLALAVVAAVAGLASSGKGVQRTRYRPDAWRLPEIVIAANGVGVAAGMIWVANEQLRIAHPGVSVSPTVSVVALTVPLLALLPLFVAPTAPTSLNRATTDPAAAGEPPAPATGSAAAGTSAPAPRQEATR